MDEQFDVVIIGAGAAGVGMGCVLRELGVDRWVILERHDVGASFARWPSEMRLISPSFNGNAFGVLDLNAVTPNTSPAWTFRTEHPSGAQYAEYLQGVAEHFELPIETGVNVLSVEPHEDGFLIRTDVDEVRTRFVIWAAGEYQYPRLAPFAGGEYCIHNATLASWAQIEGDDIVIIGGYESGIDAAINLAQLGKRVRVVDRGTPWDADDPDPSLTLAPYTHGRLQAALHTGLIELIGNTTIERIEPVANGYAVWAGDDVPWLTATPPILATGFAGSLTTILPLFAQHENGYVLLTENDESTTTPGLFVAGPNVRHGNLIFCFIYKFRQRFAVVAHALGERLNLDTTVLEWFREKGMYLDDLSCCGDSCEC